MNSDTFLKLFQYEKIEGIIEEPIKEIVIDSRKVTNGSAFVCIDGFTVDGHEFVEQAIEKGASVIIAEKEIESAIPVIYVRNTKLTLQRLAPLFYQMPSQQLKMIGVTGTNGKTTVAHMIHQYLTKLHEKSAVIGTIGFQLENRLFETDNTTPNVLDTQKLLRQAVVSDADTVTMEVSSHGLIEGRLAGVNFDIAIFTNLSHDHLDFHGTMEHYGYAKGLLFAQLGQDLTQDKAVILNADDVWSNRYRQMSPFPVQTYGFSNEADFRIEIVQKAIEQTTFFLHANNTTYSLSTHLLGAYNLSNLIAATLAVVAKGYLLEEVLALLPEIDAPKGRMERVKGDLPLSLYVDYAHSPDAIEKAIQAVLPYKKEEQRLLFLIGTGGNRDREKRPIMAQQASLADYVVLTTDDPRFESEETILKELTTGMTHDRFAAIGNREEAVRHIVQQANKNDIIIFAGKGHEDFQIIGNTKYPHSDAKIAVDEASKKFK